MARSRSLRLPPTSLPRQLLHLWIGTQATLRVAMLFGFASALMLTQRAVAPRVASPRSARATRRRSARRARRT